MTDLMTEVSRFRAWADTSPHSGRNGEWECEYDFWPSLYEATFEFISTHPLDSWSESEVRAILYAIARDNEMQYLAREVRKRHPELIQPLAYAALRMGERDDRWQLAVELGTLGIGGEQLLLEMARDEHEYVRRRALEPLGLLCSPAVEELALVAWHRLDADQEHARMMALHCLGQIGSSRLDPLLAEAERDNRQYLRRFAEEMRRNQLSGQLRHNPPISTAFH